MNIKKVLRWACIATVLTAAVSCARVTPRSVTQSSQETYIVQPPDVLQIALTPEETLTRNCTVRPDGCITFDMIGDVHVAGLTPPQIDELITERLSEYIKNVDVAVSVEATPSKMYYVLGEVGRTGSFPLNGEISARDAIAVAGGPTIRASLYSVYLVRGSAESPQAIRMNMNKAIKLGDLSDDIMIEPDDIVLVKPNVFAKVGYFLDNLFFPFQGLFGMATTTTSTIASVETGGMYGRGRVGAR